jgi:hypothetical protein
VYRGLLQSKANPCVRLTWKFPPNGHSVYSATWYSTHTCSTLLRFNCENVYFIQNLYFSWGQYVHVLRSRMPDGVRCAHFPSVITTIIDHKVQLLKPLNIRELYTTHSGRLTSRLRQNIFLKELYTHNIYHSSNNPQKIHGKYNTGSWENWVFS